MIKYQRITLLEREEISRYLALGYSLRVIAANLNRAPSSISREIHQSGVVDLKYYRARNSGDTQLNSPFSQKLFDIPLGIC